MNQTTDARGYRCCDPSCAENSSDHSAALCGRCEDEQESRTCRRCEKVYQDAEFVKGGICGNCADDLWDDAKYEKLMQEMGEEE